MLLHIYKNLFIQMLRRAGYSKKQAKTIYTRFIGTKIAKNKRYFAKND